VAILAVFQPDQRSLARITTALGDRHELVPFPRWREMREALDRLPADGCLLDPYQAAGPVELDDIQRLRERHPSLAIIVYADFKGHEMDLYTLGRFQIDGVVPAGQDESVREVRETVADALASSVAAQVVASLGRSVSRLCLDCLKWAIENSHRNPTVKDLAEPFARSPRSLTRTLSKQGAPSPGRILLWGRLFRATHMLVDRSATVEQVAYTLGYSSGAALARALRRETGYPPVEVLKRGGIGCVLDGFTRREVRSGAPRGAPRWRPSSTRSAPNPPIGRWS
jgi:AraC-like DNA-binding protein